MQPSARVVLARPHEALRRAGVERYVGYHLEGARAGSHRGLPSRHLTLVVSLEEPIEVTEMPDPRQAPGQFRASLGGLQTTPATIARRGREVGITVELGPLSARPVLGMPAAAIASTVVDLDVALGVPARDLPERLAATGSWARRFEILDTTLLASLRPTSAPADVARAWQELEATGGRIGVADLAREVGWSRRHFTERFRRETGLSPRTAGRVLRFARARALLASSDRVPLARVAADCGYADHAHLTREWNALAGCAPSRWLDEELPFVQDVPTGAGR